MSQCGQDTLMMVTVDIVIDSRFFRLTIDGVLSQLNDNFSITTCISEVAKTKTLYRGTWVALLP